MNIPTALLAGLFGLALAACSERVRFQSLIFSNETLGPLQLAENWMSSQSAPFTQP